MQLSTQTFAKAGEMHLGMDMLLARPSHLWGIFEEVCTGWRGKFSVIWARKSGSRALGAQ